MMSASKAENVLGYLSCLHVSNISPPSFMQTYPVVVSSSSKGEGSENIRGIKIPFNYDVMGKCKCAPPYVGDGACPKVRSNERGTPPWSASLHVSFSCAGCTAHGEQA